SGLRYEGVAEPTAGNSGTSASQRSIAHPFLRSYVASTGRPAQVPVTWAVAGPPYCMVQIASRCGGAKVSCPHRVFRSTAAQAPSGSGWLPRPGRQVTSYVPSMPSRASRTVTVRRSPSCAGAAGGAAGSVASAAAGPAARPVTVRGSPACAAAAGGAADGVAGAAAETTAGPAANRRSAARAPGGTPGVADPPGPADPAVSADGSADGAGPEAGPEAGP